MTNYPDTQLFIGNTWRDASDGKTIPIINPATEKKIGRVACATEIDLAAAVEAAKQGFSVWRDMTAAERSKIMRSAASLIRERADQIGHLITQEQGKPLLEGKAEALFGADVIEWFAEEGFRVYGRIVPTRASLSVRQLVFKDPIGPVAAFTPWNFPINQAVRKVGAALSAGCSVILKAPEETPAAPAALVRAFQDAGLPDGVLNLVYGDPSTISNYLITHPDIKKVSFTGSVAIGKQLAALAGMHMKRTTMELGGHAPVIICEDADIEKAAQIAVAAKFRNAGQVCISPTRYLVHQSLHRKFADIFADLAGKIIVGNGLDIETKMGPLANSRRITAMSNLVSDARHVGADVLTGGKQKAGAGYFWLPTILDNVPLDAKILHEEPFGPIAAIRPFTVLDQAIAEANRLSYGLAGYAFTQSLSNADILTRKLEVGMLWINTPAITPAEMPFGGLKDSGYGTEGGPEALDAYLNLRTATILN